MDINGTVPFILLIEENTQATLHVAPLSPCQTQKSQIDVTDVQLQQVNYVKSETV